MLIEVVTFKLSSGMSREDLLAKYRDSAEKWSTVEDLVRKTYLYDAEAGVGGGVYQWKNVEAADYWHGDDWREFVKNTYGNYPEVRRYEVPVVVENTAIEVVGA